MKPLTMQQLADAFKPERLTTKHDTTDLISFNMRATTFLRDGGGDNLSHSDADCVMLSFTDDTGMVPTICDSYGNDITNGDPFVMKIMGGWERSDLKEYLKRLIHLLEEAEKSEEKMNFADLSVTTK